MAKRTKPKMARPMRQLHDTNPISDAQWKRINDDFDRIFGDAWQPTMPAKPEPMPSPDATPVAVWPPKEGVEL